MVWKYRGEIIEEKQIYDIVTEEYTIEEFEEFLNEDYPLVEVMGRSYHLGRVLKLVDPNRFRAMYNDDCDNLAKTIIREKERVLNPFRIIWVDDE